jgi:hypothetical protein
VISFGGYTNPSTSSPIQNLLYGLWGNAILLTYGNLIGLGYFISIIILAFAGIVYLKSYSVGMSVLVLDCGIAVFGVVGNSVTGGSWLPAPVNSIAAFVTAALIAGSLYKLYAGGRQH